MAVSREHALGLVSRACLNRLTADVFDRYWANGRDPMRVSGSESNILEVEADWLNTKHIIGKRN